MTSKDRPPTTNNHKAEDAPDGCTLPLLRLTFLRSTSFVHAWIACAYAFKLINNEETTIKVSSIIAIVGSINIPIIKYSVDWWNTLHQPASIKISGSSSIHSAMLVPLLLMLLVFLLYAALIFLMKYKTEIIRIKKKNIKRI